MSPYKKPTPPWLDHIQRTAAVKAKLKVRKIYSDDKKEEARDRKEEWRRRWEEEETSESDSADSEPELPPTSSGKARNRETQGKSSTTQFGSKSNSPKINQGQTQVASSSQNMSSRSSECESCSSGGSQESGKKRESKVKEEEDEGKDGQGRNWPPIPHEIKIGIQFMLLNSRGVNEALVEQQFHDQFPELSHFKPAEYGFRTFARVLQDDQMKTHVYSNKIKYQPTWFGHHLQNSQARLEYDSGTQSFYIVPVYGVAAR